jgi:hypothetical protein
LLLLLLIELEEIPNNSFIASCCCCINCLFDCCISLVSLAKVLLSNNWLL